jgi:hypothetical protein
MRIYELTDRDGKLVGSLTEYTENDDDTDYVVLYFFEKERKPVIYENIKVFNDIHRDKYTLTHVVSVFI